MVVQASRLHIVTLAASGSAGETVADSVGMTASPRARRFSGRARAGRYNRPVDTTGTAAERRDARTRAVVRCGLVVLAMVVLVAEAAFVAWIIRERGLFDYVALDYRGSRTAGEAILEHGLGAPYDPSLLEDSQRRLYERYVRGAGAGALHFDIVPAPYPPPFSLVFVPSTLLPPVPGFLAWTLVHLLVLVLYQLRLARAFAVARPGWLIVAVLLSPPAFIHLVMGQISVWLMVFFGEALIAIDRGHRFRAGLWLGLMFFKPQALVLIVPALAVAGQWRMLGGMAAAVAAALAPTVVLAHGWVTAFVTGLGRFVDATGQEMNAFPTSMTTWRAFALNAARISPPVIGWVGAVAGMVVTAATGLFCARRLRSGDRLVVGLAWLGIAAATNAFTWHAHVHQSLLLVPPLYWVVGLLPRLQEPTGAVCLALSGGFLVAVITTTVGFAHDLLGMVLLAVLATTAAGCAVAAYRRRRLAAAAG